MTRTLAFALVGLALVLLLVLLASLSAPRVRSSAPQAWRPAPATLFSRWPDARSWSRTPDGVMVGRRSGALAGPPSTPAASVRPHPTGGLIPPYVAQKGVAGVATYYAWHQGQAAAAARLRDVLGPDWRGMVVRVDGPLGHLYVRLTDWESSLIPGRLIDLDRNDWMTLCGDPGKGICDVTVTHG